MRDTGISRPVDSMGRLVIPKELRAAIHLEEGDRLEIFTEGDAIVLRKCEPACLYCKGSSDLVFFRDQPICRACLAELNQTAAKTE